MARSDTVEDGFSRLLYSNSPPTPLEATSAQVRVDALRAEVERLGLLLQQTQQELTQYQAVLAPIRHMPLEILGEIFGWAVPYHYHKFAEYRSALNDLTLVCKAWHEAAHLTHRLWGDIREGTLIHQDPSFDQFPLWFAKAKEAPKSLYLNGVRPNDCHCHGTSTPDRDCPRNQPALIKLLAVGPPLHHLEIACSTSKYLHHFLSAIHNFPSNGGPHSWSALHSLDLFVGLEYDPAAVADPNTLLRRLPPALSTLRLQFVTRTPQFNVPPEVLKNLTSFGIDCPWDAIHILKILRHCTKVERLEICLSRDIFSDGDTSLTLKSMRADRIHLPQVHCLELCIRDDVDAAIFLRCINVPALKTISIAYIDQSLEYEPALWDTLASLDVVSDTRRNSPGVALRILRIQAAVSEEEDPLMLNTEMLHDILSDIPSLTEFSMGGITFSAPEFLDIHKQREQEDDAYTLLPCIQRITFENCVNDEFDILSFLNYLKERHRAKATLHRKLGGHGSRDSLRTVEFRSRNAPFHLAYTAAQPVIHELEQEYEVVVDRYVR